MLRIKEQETRLTLQDHDNGVIYRISHGMDYVFGGILTEDVPTAFVL